MKIEIKKFKDSYKIFNLVCYSFKYYKNIDFIKKQLIKRKKKFIDLKNI